MNTFLLDMDDTLLDFKRAERENLLSVLSSFGIAADGKTACRFHEINDALWKALERGEIKRERIVTKRFELLFAEYGFSADSNAVAEAYFNGLAEVCFPFAGTEDFLAALKERGRIYIVTNGSAYIQRRHLRDARIMPYTDGVFISDEVGANKPSVAYAGYVAAHIPRFNREQTVYVGDSLTSDLVCAQRMGVRFLLFAPKGAPAGYGGACARTYGEALRFIDLC